MENLKKFKLTVDEQKMHNDIARFIQNTKEGNHQKTYATLLNLIDLTTLTEKDNEKKIETMCQKVNGFEKKFSDLQNVAAICVYPSMVKYVKKHLDIPDIQIASVGGGFPASQTFTEIKVQECKAAVDAGANEIDIVIPVGEYLAGNDHLVYEEVKSIKKAIGQAHLKVILETGDLKADQIRKASLIAMEAGADFIKTSTGKIEESATYESMYIMCEAIKDYYDSTGKITGIKPAGGIRETESALVYYEIVKSLLGDTWLNNDLFRIGASSLANNLLQTIKGDADLKYF